MFKRWWALPTTALILAGCQMGGVVPPPGPTAPAVADGENAPVVLVLPEAIATTNADPVPAPPAVAEPVQLPLPSAADEAADGFLAQLRAGFRLDHDLERKQVRKEIDWLVRNAEYLANKRERGLRYLPYICAEVHKRELPAELCLIPIIESALRPHAFSPQGAVGLWQFMPSTARRFDLTLDWWTDQRRDVALSTDAALDYLEQLHERFGDWTLALAAYNCGEGRMHRTLRRTPGAKTAFDLRLPRETEYYVARILAYAAVFADPERFGVELPFGPLDSAAPRVAVVETGGQIDLARAAEAIGQDMQYLYNLNPALKRWATPPNGPHQLLVRAEHAPEAQAALASLSNEERMLWARVRIGTNDTLSGIASEYSVAMDTLSRVNGVRGTRIEEGDFLMVPTPFRDWSDYPTPFRTGAGGDAIYVVRSGDSLWKISRRLDLDMNLLMRANELTKRSVLQIGQRLSLPGLGGTRSIEEKQVTQEAIAYRVRRNDSLSTIAARFKVSVAKLVDWNDIDPKALIHPGQRLVVRPAEQPPAGG